MDTRVAYGLEEQWTRSYRDESEVEFQERFLHGKIWLGNSTLNFKPHGQTENFSAHNDVLSIFEISQVILQTKCDKIHIQKKNNYKKKDSRSVYWF
ncbi:tRNA uridine 5-carboxymethylaminomethyl modification enzyme MnmG [Dirofilaria immitis]